MYEHDAKLVYSLCPMRFVYEYVLGDSSAYRSEYQQNRAIVRLIQIFSKLRRESIPSSRLPGRFLKYFQTSGKQKSVK